METCPQTCQIRKCDKPVFARQMCSMHYSRLQRHGDPMYQKRNSPMVNGATAKSCPRCGVTHPLDAFGFRDVARTRLRGWCKACENKYARDAIRSSDDYRERRRTSKSTWNESNRGYFLQYRYGITREEYDRLLVSQHGCCAICGTAPQSDRVLDVDHCHTTNCIRGLLCGPCNRGLGHFQDDLTRLRAAADYLDKTSA